AGHLAAKGISGDAASDPLTGKAGVWLEQKDWQAAEEQHLYLYGPTDFILRDLEGVLTARLSEFLDLSRVTALLNDSPSREIRAIAKSPDQMMNLTTMLK